MTNKIDSSAPFDAFFAARHETLPAPIAQWSRRFVVFKYICDKGFVIIALPFVVFIALILLAVNPVLNPGPLFFRQERMGMGGRRFTMWKFRTMEVAETKVRGHDAPLEEDRIPAFARYLRQSRIDELPNLLNVLIGDMSLVGPRPDAWEHSAHYVLTIAYYNDRFRVRPGITGLAQVRGGYADTTRAVERKARFDRFYVKKSRIRLDIYILWQTVVVVLTGFGAR